MYHAILVQAFIKNKIHNALKYLFPTTIVKFKLSLFFIGMKTHSTRSKTHKTQETSQRMNHVCAFTKVMYPWQRHHICSKRQLLFYLQYKHESSTTYNDQKDLYWSVSKKVPINNSLILSEGMACNALSLIRIHTCSLKFGLMDDKNTIGYR